MYTEVLEVTHVWQALATPAHPTPKFCALSAASVFGYMGGPVCPSPAGLTLPGLVMLKQLCVGTPFQL